MYSTRMELGGKASRNEPGGVHPLVDYCVMAARDEHDEGTKEIKLNYSKLQTVCPEQKMLSDCYFS